jgi:outer membrane protein assembly factor BamB
MKNIEIYSTKYKDDTFDIEFPFKAYNAVLLEDRLIAGFSFGEIQRKQPNSEFWRAVWCFDKVGNVLWKVESPYYISKETGEKVYYPCVENGRCTDAVSSVVYNEKRNVLLAGARMIYKLDPETGKLTEIDHTER